jgi:hypothetical protein
MIGVASRMKHLAAFVVVMLAACGGKPHTNRAPAHADTTDDEGVDRPKTHDAADRARAEAAASPDEPVPGDGKHWGGWRYQGARDDCFFVVGRRCFADQRKACAAAKCKSDECDVTGGGPATVSCK